MRTNAFECMYQESFNSAIILPEKVSMFKLVSFEGFVITQGNSDLVDWEAFQTGFWKKKPKTGRGLGVLKEWKVNCC